LKPEEVNDLAGRANLALVPIPAEKRTEEQKADLRKYFRENHATDLKNAEQELAKAQKSKDDLMQQIPSTMVMKEMDKPRDTFILVRGNFQNKGEKVSPGVPKAFSPQPDGTPTNRLALAKWLVSPDHPLTARCTVNRYWQNALRDWNYQNQQRFWVARRLAEPPGVARLARDGVYGPELGCKIDAETDGDLSRVSAGLDCHTPVVGARSLQSAPDAQPAFSARCGNDPRQRARG
jgi:hypothetical protein